MKWLENRVLWGALLILAGVFFLVQTVFFPNQGGVIWAFLFGLAGLLFIGFFVANPQRWWALLPGVILLTLGLMIGLTELSEDFAEGWGGSFFLGGIGLAFWLVYLANRTNWWAIIPGGVLLTLAVVASPIISGGGWDDGAIFFLGLGLTFALVGLLPSAQAGGRRQSWAFIPAVALLAMGAVISAAATDLAGYILPIALIAGGVLLLYQAFVRRTA